MGWTTFWVICSATHLITLVEIIIYASNLKIFYICICSYFVYLSRYLHMLICFFNNIMMHRTSVGGKIISNSIIFKQKMLGQKIFEQKMFEQKILGQKLLFRRSLGYYKYLRDQLFGSS
jgi:hypothetical protein